VRITQSRFTGNSGLSDAGALDVAGGIVFITTSTFDHNASDGSGAISDENQATLVVTNSSFTENGAFNGGGGIGIIGGGRVVVTNTTFARNNEVSIGTGSAIRNDSGSLILINSTLAENSGLRSTLVSTASATTLVQNTIVARSLHNSSDCAGPIRSLGNNLIGDLTGCSIILQPSDLIGDPGLGPFTDDGSPGNAHFPLLPTSRAIDTGNDAACPEADQIGQHRHQCDIGAIAFRP
jgi:hypothetical protein